MKVLVAGDDALSRLWLERTLALLGYEVVTAKDGTAAWEILGQPASVMPRLAVLDLTMPGLDALEICKRVRAAEGEDHAYLVIVTARDGVADIARALEAGADDHVGKPFDERELKVRLRAGARIVELQAGLVAAKAALRQQALHDGLTGLLNGSAIKEELGREMGRAERQGAPVGVLLFDVDHLKRINDGYGHATGDRALQAISAIALAQVRPYDRVGRHGGEEFLVVLPGCDTALAAEVGERLRSAIEATPFAVGGDTIKLTCSFGVSSARRSRELDVSFEAADRALYRAKREGRNRVVLAAPLPGEAAVDVEAEGAMTKRAGYTNDDSHVRTEEERNGEL